MKYMLRTRNSSVLFVRIFNSLLRDRSDSYMGVFMSLRQDKMDGNSI